MNQVAIISVRLPVGVAERLRHAANRDDRPVSALIRRYVLRCLEADAEKSAEA